MVLIHTGYGDRGGPCTGCSATAWLATVGRHSYSLYLWHVVPFLLLEDVAAPKLGARTGRRGDGDRA